MTTTTTETTMDRPIGMASSALAALHVTKQDAPASTTSTATTTTPTPTTTAPSSTNSNTATASPTTIHNTHSRNSSRASSTASSLINTSSTTTADRPRSRNNTRSSQASARGKLPDAADPEYSYVYVPPLSALPHAPASAPSSKINLSKGDLEASSVRSDMTGRSANGRNALLDATVAQSNPPRPRSSNAMLSGSENHHPSSSGERNGRMRDRTRSEEWADRGSAVMVREVSNRNGATSTRVIKKGVRDFEFGRPLGEGSYSSVVAATDRSTLKEYAIKMLDKRHIIKEKKVKYVNIEKNTLNRLGDHPGIVKLYFTFQDETTLYFVLDLAVNGELLGFIKKLGTFSEECTKYYAALLLDALEYMHIKGVIHRDLKPENILLDANMRIKITDFGTAKLLDLPNTHDSPAATPQYSGDDTSSRANSFVGTAEYVSPELLTDKSACKSSDLWAFGCIVYQLLAGRPPFKASNEYQTFQKIVNLEYDFPLGFPEQARDLVSKLLVLDPEKRLSIRQIKRHPFFEGQEWGRALWKQKAPRLRPLKPGIVASFGSTPAAITGPEREVSQRYANGTGDIIVASVPEVPPPRSYEDGNRVSAASSSTSAYPPFQRDYRSSSDLNSPNRQSAPPPIVATQPQNRHSYHSLPRHSIPRPRSQPRLSIFQQNVMSEADVKWAKTLNLNGNERIIKVGKAIVLSYSHGGKTSTPGKFARKFLGKKKERTLILTNEGRAFLISENHDDVPDLGDSGKIKGTIPLDKFSVITLEDDPKGRTWSVESGQTKFTLEDPEKKAAQWVEAFQRIAEDLPEPAGAYLSAIRYTQSMDLQEMKTSQQPSQSGQHPRGRIRKGEIIKEAASAF